MGEPNNLYDRDRMMNEIHHKEIKQGASYVTTGYTHGLMVASFWAHQETKYQIRGCVGEPLPTRLGFRV